MIDRTPPRKLNLTLDQDPHGIFANYDVDKALATLESVRGMLKGIDHDAFMEELYAAREQEDRKWSA